MVIEPNGNIAYHHKLLTDGQDSAQDGAQKALIAIQNAKIIVIRDFLSNSFSFLFDNPKIIAERMINIPPAIFMPATDVAAKNIIPASDKICAFLRAFFALGIIVYMLELVDFM